MTAILETAGSRSVVLPDGKKIAGKRWLALAFWELVTTGAVTLPNSKRLEVEPKDWIETGKWLYKHIDGDARQELDVTSKGESIKLDDSQLVNELAQLFNAARERAAKSSGAGGEIPLELEGKASAA